MRKTIIKILVGVLILIAGAAAVLAGYGWFTAKQARVAAGVARPSFPYGDYNVDELNKMYPQYANEDVATTQTPEETHAKFIAALKAGDLDGAVECCFRQGDWEEMKEGLRNVKEKGQMEQMVKDLDTEIKKDFMGDTKATYFYSVFKDNQKYKEYMGFIKSNRGVWLIESL